MRKSIKKTSSRIVEHKVGKRSRHKEVRARTYFSHPIKEARKYAPPLRSERPKDGKKQGCPPLSPTDSTSLLGILRNPRKVKGSRRYRQF